MKPILPALLMILAVVDQAHAAEIRPNIVFIYADDWPGHTPAGAKNNTTVFTAVDLLPTLCAASNITLQADYQVDGENRLGAFEGKDIRRTRPIFWQWLGNKNEPDWWPRLAVRDGDWKQVMTEDAQHVEL